MSDISQIALNGVTYNVKDSTARTETAKKVTASGGDTANTKIASSTTSSEAFPVPVAGDTHKVILGKIIKFFSDFKALKDGLVTIGMMSNQNINDQNKIPTSALLHSVNKKVDDLNSDLANKLNSSVITAQYNKLLVGTVKIQFGALECIVNYNGQASLVFPEEYSGKDLYRCMAVPMSGSYTVRSITNSGTNNSLALLLDGNDQKPEYQSKIWMQYIVIGT